MRRRNDSILTKINSWVITIAIIILALSGIGINYELHRINKNIAETNEKLYQIDRSLIAIIGVIALGKTGGQKQYYQYYKLPKFNIPPDKQRELKKK